MPHTLLYISSLLLTACSTPSSLTLEVPERGFEVVQQAPKGSNERDRNALYLPPRRIEAAEFGTPQLREYIDSMYAVMLRKAGVGIASSQLGKSLQIFIIEAKADNPRYQVLGPVPKQVFINPRITAASQRRMNFWHGCLSAHGEPRGNVATYEWIEYEAQNESGERITGRLEGFAAVIFQHELRHLLGGTYLDHATHFLLKDELDAAIRAGEQPFFEEAEPGLPLLLQGYEIGESVGEYWERRC